MNDLEYTCQNCANNFRDIQFIVISPKNSIFSLCKNCRILVYNRTKICHSCQKKVLWHDLLIYHIGDILPSGTYSYEKGICCKKCYLEL
jgi:hypothetical protein